MSLQRRISWQQVQRDLRADRAASPDIREQRLRPFRLKDGSYRQQSGWRGLSGKHTIFTVEPVAVDPLLAAAPEAVVLAVIREADGSPVILDVTHVASDDSLAAAALDARTLGATELHVHRPLDASDDCARIAADLLLAVTRLAAKAA